MKSIITLVMIMLALSVFSCSEGAKDSMAQNKKEATTKIGTTDMNNFTLTFNQGLEKSAKENKNMIVDFYTDWCHWCKVMDEKTFKNDSVAKKLSERFITVRMNAEDPNQTATFQGRTFNNIELTRAFQVSGFPSLAFISPAQEVITVMPGYIPAEQFGYILDYIDQKCWEKKMTLEEFMKRKGECAEPDSTKAKSKS